MQDQDPIKEDLATVASTDKKCFYCGYTYHKRKVCPPEMLIASSVVWKGNSKPCAERKRASLSVPVHNQLCLPFWVSTMSRSISHEGNCSRPQATCFDWLGNLSEFHKWEDCAGVLPWSRSACNVSMAHTDLTVRVSSSCTAYMTIGKRLYTDAALGIMPGFCCDLLLGQGFQQLHKRVI